MTTQEREKELENFEVEMILFRWKNGEESFKSKFKSSSKNLDDILSCQLDYLVMKMDYVIAKERRHNNSVL